MVPALVITLIVAFGGITPSFLAGIGGSPFIQLWINAMDPNPLFVKRNIRTTNAIEITVSSPASFSESGGMTC